MGLNAPPGAPAVLPAQAPKPAIPQQVVCSICSTTFAPGRTRGRCPVCGEQVIPAADATRTVPLITPVGNWLFRDGNWRLAAVGALVLYQIILFIILWIHLAQIHAL